MKRTTRINIGNQIFNIDEDAFSLLDKYLTSIEKYFEHSNEGKEIVNDIENRIAEHFHKTVNKAREVISVNDVQEIIETIGHPDEFYINNPNENKNAMEKIKLSRRLYRDMEDRYLGGVASGIAGYLGFDPLIIRILFVLLGVFGGGGVFIYIVLWVVIPPAESTVQRLEMRGKRINLENIEDSIKREFHDFKSSWKNKKF